MWSVYVLQCEDGNLYTGISNNIQARFKEHLAGKGGKYTRSHKPLKIVYSEGLSSKSAALKREYEIKSWSRKQKINLLKLCL